MPCSMRPRVTIALMMALLAMSGRPAPALDLQHVLTGYSINGWTERNGIRIGAVSALAQDDAGYLWVGTEDGLLRFDGARFQAWNDMGRQPLPPGAVSALSRVRNGDLWVALKRGGLYRIRNGQVTQPAATHLIEGSVVSLAEDAEGTLWVGSQRGLYTVSGHRVQPHGGRAGIGAAEINSLYLSHGGDLWVATPDGLFRRSRQFGFRRAAFPGNPVRAIAEDAVGKMWFTDRIGGFRSPEGLAPRPPLQGRGETLLHDRYGNLWVGTRGQGLWRVSRDGKGTLTTTVATVGIGLLDDVIWTLLEDESGAIWVGTNEGLNLLVPQDITAITTIGLVRAVVATPDEGIWVGTARGLIRMSQRGRERRLPALDVETMHRDRRGTLWVANLAGFGRYRKGRFEMAVAHQSTNLPTITAMTSDSKGRLWLADRRRGVYRWFERQLTSVALPRDVASRPVSALHTDSQDRVWLGFNNGRLAIINQHDHVRMVGPEDGLPADTHHGISAITESSTGAIWIAGTGGLSRYFDGRFVTLGEAHGLPDEHPVQVLEDQAGRLWVATRAAIISIEPDEIDRAITRTDYRIRYRLFDQSDGLAGRVSAQPLTSSAKAVRGHDGRLWFVTARGLTVIDPATLESPPQSLGTVHIEGAVVDDRPVDALVSGATLPPNPSKLQIDYTALKMPARSAVRFRYRLDGFDTAWVDAGTRRQAFYTNLGPGRYRFRVTGSSAKDTYRPLDASWDFTIPPAFYQTVAFKAAVVLAVLLAIWGLSRTRERQLRSRYALVLGERARLSREIHDTLLQSMVGVALEIDDVSSELDESAATTRTRLTAIRRRVEEYASEAARTIGDLRSPLLDTYGLADAFRAFAAKLTPGTSTSVRVKVTGKERSLPDALAHQVLRIGQEALSNAVRHARASRVTLDLEFRDTGIRLCVSDDGMGFDTLQSSGGRRSDGHYGLAMMRERTEQAGGEFRIRSGSGAGTEITALFSLSGSGVDAIAT